VPLDVVVTSLGYELVARASKARSYKACVIAWILHQAVLPSSDVAQMSPALWKQFAAGLKQHGLLRAHSTPPSAETIARTIAELRKLEQVIPVCGTARIPRLPEAA
jgi:hypothetical protein